MDRRDFVKTCAMAVAVPLSGLELAASAANFSSKYTPIAGGSGLWVQPVLIFALHKMFPRPPYNAPLAMPHCPCDECMKFPSQFTARFTVYDQEGKWTNALAPPLSRYIYSLHSELPGHVFSLKAWKDDWNRDTLEAWASLPISIAEYFIDFETGKDTWPRHPTQL